MLAALTEADSIATGPSMWGSWKAGLLRDLVARTKHVLGGGHVEEVASEFPTAEMLEWMAAGERVIVGRGSTMSVVAPDSHGHFSRLAGVMAISGLDVLDASAYSSDGMAATEFVVQSSTGAAVEWDRVIELAHAALDRRLALSARIAQRARSYARFHRRLAASPPRRYVHIDNTLSDAATVVDVHTPDTIGVLYKITQVVAELNLGIMSAKVHTLGPDAVDSFYLCDVHGNKVTDPSVLGELELALTEITRDSDTAQASPSSPVPSKERVMTDRTVNSQELLRWAESLAGIARTGLGFTENQYERERFEEVLAVASDIRSHVDGEDAARFHGEWLKVVGSGIAGYVTPKVAIGAVVGDDQGRILLIQRSDSGSGSTPPGGPTSAIRRPRSRSRRCRRRPASSAM
ncbi:MAG: NUDIX hydrolase N-terminal domain-containing protein [Acidimicrobiales bacterium]